MNKTIVLVFLGDFFFDARCINMADTIIDAGVNINIIDTGNSGDQYRGKKIYHISLSLNGVFKYFKFYQETKKLLYKINPQQIIAGDLYSLPAAASFKNAHIIYDSREIYTQLAGLINKPISQAFWSWIERININKTKSVLVTAKGDGIILKKLYRTINVVHIYNFPSIKMKPKGNVSLREKLNITTEYKIFLYQGVLHKGRGIKAMIQLLEDFPNAYAVILGDGPYRKELQDFSEKINLEKRIHFLGKVPYKEMLELTYGADIGFSIIRPISQSYEQALPNKLFEYALAGIPIIASNLPEMEKMINKYDIGCLVNHDDSNAQMESITKILNNVKKKEIQKIAEKHLVWETQENLFLNTLNLNG